MFLLDNQDYDPFKDFFNNFSKALSDDHRLTDIKDNGDVYRVSIELPWYKKGDVKAEVNDGILTVIAEKDGKTSYQNSFSIKSDVDTKSITANLEYGILTLTLPKKEVSKPRKINLHAVFKNTFEIGRKTYNVNIIS